MISLSLPDEAWIDIEPGTEALLEQWLVGVGDQVEAGQVLAHAVLIKTTYDIIAPQAGVVAEILVPEEGTFAQTTPIGMLQPSAPHVVAPTELSTSSAGAAAVDDPKISGHHLLPLTGLRGSVARAMSIAWQAPQVAMTVDVDMTRCLERREVLRTAHNDTSITVTPLIIRATALVLQAHPALNAWLTEQGVELVPEVHIALAVNVDAGLLTPVIRNADQKSSLEISAEAQQLAAAARSSTLLPNAFQGGTFTVSNLGMTGIDWFTPILNPPQVAILGVSRIALQPVVRDEGVVPAPLLTLTLVFDHRAVDGYPAALFLADLRTRLEAAVDL